LIEKRGKKIDKSMFYVFGLAGQSLPSVVLGLQILKIQSFCLMEP
jgi:hypothetical protein